VAIQASRAARARQIALIEAARPKWLLPIPKGKFVVSSCFEPRWGTFHYGVDMAAPEGTPFYAAGDGTVIEAGPMSGFGNAIMIQHADGTITVYGHEEKYLVEKGEKVKAGQLIGLGRQRGREHRLPPAFRDQGRVGERRQGRPHRLAQGPRHRPRRLWLGVRDPTSAMSSPTGTMER
jgi:Membrane proteins related to metalloendopeptidases